MTASRAERRPRLRAAAALLLALAVPVAAGAQSGGPTRIVPPSDDAPAPSGEGPSGITVQDLPQARFESAGTLAPSEGGLGGDMWAGTVREIIVGNLGNLPAHPAAPTVRDVERRLLLTPAELPQGLQVGPDVLTLRARRLHAMGALDGLVALFDRLPAGERGAELGRVEVETRLAAGQYDQACAVADRHVRRHDAPLFSRVKVMCHVMRGESDMAVFTLGLLREEQAADPRFLSLLAAMQGEEEAAVDSMADPTPLELAMLFQAGRGFPVQDVDTLSPLALRALAQHQDAAARVRLEAVERGVDSGLVPARLYQSALREVAAGVEPRGPEQLENSGAEGTELRVQAYASATGAADPETVALVLTEAWARAARDGASESLMAYATVEPLAAIEPAPDLAWFAADAARAAYIAGRRALGDRWYGLMQRTGAVTDANALWPVAHLSAPGRVPWAEDRLDAWYASSAARDQAMAERRAAVLFASLDGIERDARARADWGAMLGAGRAEAIATTVPRVWRHARSAAFEGRRGEAILLALGALGDRHPAQIDPAELRTLLFVLASVGLADEARSVAIDAFLAAGA